MPRLLFFLTTIFIAAFSWAVAPGTTDYSWDLCRGSARPYPVPAKAVDYPDTLTPVMINHVGRHGARFPASPSHSTAVLRALEAAMEQGTITPLGRKLMVVVGQVNDMSQGRWGALDSLGMAEQRGIAARMYASYPMLFDNGRVSAVSSYVPRCVMSMYEFTHEISRCHPKTEISTASGPRYSSLLRFFDHNTAYSAVVESEKFRDAIATFNATSVPMSPLRRVLGKNFQMPLDSVKLALDEYSLLAGLDAMGLNCDITTFFTPKEYNALWSAFNFKQYLCRTATTLSAEPARIAEPLLFDLISTTDAFVRGDTAAVATVNLRFGHAETLMPLLSLIRLPGCAYLTYNFDTVAKHWRDFDVVPMAANLQFILFRSDSGRYYLRVDHNEVPVPLIPGSGELYIPWSVARSYLISCLPL